MKMSQDLMWQIAQQFADTHEPDLLPEPPMPTADEFHALIENTVPYLSTTERDNLAHSHTLNIDLLSEGVTQIKMTHALPMFQKPREIKNGWSLDSEWTIHCQYGDNDVISISPSRTSNRALNAARRQKELHEVRHAARSTLEKAGTIPAVRKNHPEFCKLDAFKKAEAYMIAKREEAKARKRNKKPLEKVELETDPSMIIAKARLLGAKYVP